MWERIELVAYYVGTFVMLLIASFMCMLLISFVFVGELCILAAENPDALRDFAYGLGRILGMPAD